MSNSLNNHDWIELAAMTLSGMVRNQWVQAANLSARTAWRQRFDNRDVYASICRFAKPSRQSEFVCPFYLDVDCETDLSEAARQVIAAADLMADHIGILPECLDISFSGAKGFHVVVPLQTFGYPDVPGKQVLAIWRSLAVRLAKEAAPNIDLIVYQPSRVLRMANSINSKSGLYKIPLEYKELRDLGLEHVLEVARQMRTEETMAMPEECPKAIAWLHSAIRWLQSRSPRGCNRSDGHASFNHGWRVPPCIRALEETVLPDGLRHAAYLALARFYAWIGMHIEEAMARIEQVDHRHPIRDFDYIARITRYGHEHPRFPGCENPALKRYCDMQCFRLQHDRSQVGPTVEKGVPGLDGGSHENELRP